jgi:hypothetical protein
MNDTLKNPILTEMEEMLENSDYTIDDEVFGSDAIMMPRTQFIKFKNEVRAKTNYVNTLIDQQKQSNTERNNMATNNYNLLQMLKNMEQKGKQHYKLIQIAGSEINEIRDKIAKLCETKETIEKNDILTILNDYDRFEVDETALVNELDTKVDTEYKS